MATPVVIPKQGQSVDNCIIVQWLKEVGEQVEVDEPVCEVETDKAVFEVTSPVPGVILTHYFVPGDEVPVHQMIAAVGAPGEAAPALVMAEDGPTEPSIDPASAPATGSPSPPSVATVESLGISPRAARLAAETGVDVSALAGGTGPGGRIIERDVMDAAPGSVGGQEAAPLRGVRRVVASRMSKAARTTAPITLHAWADAASLTTTRQRLAEGSGETGPTITDLLAAVVVEALSQHPDLNATFDGETIMRYDQVHLGLAVDTPRGLLVPVLHDADRLSLSGLAAESARLVEACRDGSVLPDDLVGGTFTLTNLGGFGIEHFTPILNPPQVAILGVGAILPRPVADNGGIVLVPHIGLSLTVDHRVVDGAPAARFLQAIASGLAGIERLERAPAPPQPQTNVPSGTP